MSIENPFAFEYDIDFCFTTDYGRQHYIEDPDVGETYLKMTVLCKNRSHDGYCSSYHDGEAYVEERLLTIYMKIPDFMYTDDKKLNRSFFDEEWCLINKTNTASYFMDWSYPSINCEGSGCCELTDTYIPLKIVCVTMT
jgi:hypothetical protein